MNTTLIDLRFDTPDLDARLRWHAPPPRWCVDTAARALRVEPAAGSDFWQRTHYGFRRDDGHFLHMPVAGDFVMTAHVRFAPAHQYDQAGLMVRISGDCWLKTSVEFEPDGPSRLGAVVTNGGYSDWSTQAFAPGQRSLWLRVRRKNGDCIVEHGESGAAWEQLRVAHLVEDDGMRPVAAGLYACSPQGSGFVAEFAAFRIELGLA